MYTRRIMVCLAIAILLVLPQKSYAQSDTRYVYLKVAQDEQATLNLVDPTSPNAVAQTINVTVPSGYFPPSIAVIDPTGEYIVLGFRNDTEKWFLRVVYLPDPTTTNNVAQNVSLSNVAWSVDGERLGWVQYADDNTSSIKVYSNATHTVTTILSNQSTAKQFTWSPDNPTRIAVSSGFCTPANVCTLTLSRINVATQAVEKNIDLSYLSPGSGAIFSAICTPRLSPTNSNGQRRYISFISQCDYGTILALQDVFVWDTVQNTVTQLTHFTDEAKAQGYDYSTSIYYTDWAYDQWLYKETLMLGVITYSSFETPSTKTKLISLGTNQQFDVSTAAATEFVENTWTGEWAYRNVPAVSGAYFNAVNPSVQIATYEGNEFAVVYSGPNGCDLAWSADGEYLAFTERDATCGGPIQGVSFVPTEGGVVTHHSVSQPYRRIIPAGWMQLGGNFAAASTSRVRPTATPSITTPLTQKLILTPQCSPDPTKQRVWRVQNPNAVDVPFTWHLYQSKQVGSGVVKANGEVILQTTTVPNTRNALRIFVNGKPHRAKASDTTTCGAASAPSRTP